MKICDITQFYSPVGGGVKRYITEKRAYIQQRGEDEHVLIVPGAKTETVKDGRLTTCTIASPPVNKTSRYRILFNLRQAGRFIAQEKPDVIEAGDPYHLAWRAIKVGRELNIPVCGFYHSHFPEAYLRTALKYCGTRLKNMMLNWAQRYIVRLYNKFDATLVPSEFLAALLKDWGVSNVIPVHLGVNTAVFSPGAPAQITRAKLNLPEDAFLLLYVGRLAGEKNTPLLLETFRLLQRQKPGKFAFLVIGDGQLREQVVERRRELPLLRWVPYCRDSQELADYYRMANLFVHPGVCETFGLVSLESQACGCPVVGIRGSYMDANIFAGLDLWSKENTPEGLCEAILKFSEADIPSLGNQASVAARENYSWEKVFNHLWDCYRQVIAQRRRIA
ncbi:MAG: glycosyltransferase [bacterium]